MNIAIVAKLWEEVSPLSRGGTGASLSALVNGLADKGHRISLFASGDSETKAAELVSVRQKPYRGDYSEIHEYENIAEAFRRHKEFDIIHCAVEHKSVLFGDLVETPSLHSIRYGEFFEHELSLLRKYKHLYFMGNSKGLKRILPFLNWRGVVYNGVDTNLFPYNDDPDPYFLYLARVSPQKGVDKAIEAAIETGQKLIIAGKMSETDKDFLDKKVIPFIDGNKIIYAGEAGPAEKIRLLSSARALIQPVSKKMFDACSNSILEAMACGTPVIASDAGANRELVEHGKTGFIAGSKRQIIEAMKKMDKINRLDCRDRIEKKFSARKMVSEYEKLYKRIINSKH